MNRLHTPDKPWHHAALPNAPAHAPDFGRPPARFRSRRAASQLQGRVRGNGAHAIGMFGEQLTPVASPWLLKSGAPLKKAADLGQFALIEAGDAHHTHLEWLTWRRWFDERGTPKLQPKRWLYFNYAYQMVQAALTGQGIVLARLPLVAESLANGDLVEPLPQQRMDSPMAYWLIIGPRSAQRPEIKAFCDWLMAQSKATRQTIGEVPDPDTVDGLD